MSIYPNYPGAADLNMFLGTLGATVPPMMNLQAKCDSAVAEWENRTGWLPWLTKDTTLNPSTRLFDPPAPPSAYGRMASFRGGRYLNLQGGLLSLTSLSIGVVPNAAGVYDGSSGTQGTPLVENLYFYLRPLNATARNYPYTDIEFIFPVSGIPQSISIVGVWGRESTLSGSVWQVILQKAAALCIPEISLGVSGGLVKIDNVQYVGAGGQTGFSPILAQWDTAFNHAIHTHKRVSL